jgi:hypothetical protein
MRRFDTHLIGWMRRFDTYLVHVMAKFGSAALTTLFSVNIQRLLEPGHGKVTEFFS